MSNNDKNLLQEICQKNKIPLPKYTTFTTDNQYFLSSVDIIYNNISYQITGHSFRKKKWAELSAATKMLNYIKTLREKEIIHYKNKSQNDIYILIDIENIHMGDFFEQRKFSKSFHFIGFATEHHSSIDIAPSELDIITIKSDRRDAADTLMIGYTATLIGENSFSIVIVTKDHFGTGLVDYINQMNPDINARSIKTIDELSEYLNTIMC